MGVDEKDNLKVETETVICAAKEEALRRKRVRNKKMKLTTSIPHYGGYEGKDRL